jgi:hypothetical protein
VGRGLGSILAADDVGIAVSRSRRLVRRRGRALLQSGRLLLQGASSHAGVVSDGLAADEGWRTLRERWAGGRTQRRGCESMEGRHGCGGYMCCVNEVATLMLSPNG